MNIIRSMLAKEDKVYGKIWGHLSNMNVHTTQANSSPAMFLADGMPTFQLFGLVPRDKEDTRRFTIEFSIFATHACLQLAEIVFFPFAVDPETLTKSDQDGFARNKGGFKFQAQHWVNEQYSSDVVAMLCVEYKRPAVIQIGV